MKMVRRHLERKYVIQEEELLERIAESSERGKLLCQTDREHLRLVYMLVWCVFHTVVQLRRNPPSPLNRSKRKSGQHEKHSEWMISFNVCAKMCQWPLSLPL